MSYDAAPPSAPLLCERARSFPFLTDGETLYLIEGWRAEASPPRRIRARKLGARERALVEEALRDAAEEAAYRVSGRVRPARPARS
jgi:hypothetical protein